MAERATQPLNPSAVSAADDTLYVNHEDDPRPNALFDENGGRKPLDPNDPDQAALRKEWMDAYTANGGQVETDSGGGNVPPDAPIVSCERRATVNPVIQSEPIELDESQEEPELPEPQEDEEDETLEEEEEPQAVAEEENGDGVERV